MRKEQFIDALYAAGWVPRNDAQNMATEQLWRKLFPLVAELEDELNDAHAALRGEGEK